MTRIKFYVRDNNVIYRVLAKGHADFAEDGSDIVCAGISTMLQTALLGLLKVAKIEMTFSVNEQDGTLDMSLPQELTDSQRHDAAVILNTLLEGISDFCEGYSDYVTMEVI